MHLIGTAYSLTISGIFRSNDVEISVRSRLVEIEGESRSSPFAPLQFVLLANALQLLFKHVFVFLVLVLEHLDALKHLQIAAHALIGVEI